MGEDRTTLRSPSSPIITGHVPSFLHDATAMLRDQFHIGHATIQVERDEEEACALAPSHVV